MNYLLVRTFVILAVSLPVIATEESPRTLSFEQRVQAQEAIQRLQYSHQVGATRPFEEAVSREALEAKVRRYLKKSVALETYWGKPVSGESLSRELRRIARETRFPERLERIYQALGHDPVLIQECFVRPALVERLTYEWYARERLDSGKDWNAWWDSVEPTLDERSVHLPDDLSPVLPPIGGDSSFAPERAVGDCDSWSNGALGEVPQAAGGHTAIWTGTEMLVFGGTLSWAGWRYDPLIDDWRPMARTPIEFVHEQDSYYTTQRPQHTAIWTGSEMIVWGNNETPIGGRYDPLSDTWTAMQTAGAPEPRTEHSAVWTDTEMIIWGGRSAIDSDQLDDGFVYSPVFDSWAPISLDGAPEYSRQHVAVWTGQQMIVWNGPWNGPLQPWSGLYIRSLDAWVPISSVGAPPAFQGMTAVWTGEEMIVWGGDSGGVPSDQGGQYDPRTNNWSPVSQTNAPSARTGHSAVWTGEEMIVWGGTGEDDTYLNDGGRYDPSTDTWSPLNEEGAPMNRSWHSFVWTGDEMIVWGGLAGLSSSSRVNSGGRYDPDTDSWLPTSEGPPTPAARKWHGSVWTGTEMIVWGGWISGYASGGLLGNGGRYDPLVDAWNPVSTAGAPEGGFPQRTKAVWTGTEMLVKVWSEYGRYDPLQDLWLPMAAGSASSIGTSSIWTGEKWILWGGQANCASDDTGQSYDPATDEWSPVTTVGAPTGRQYHSAVWTGSELIVWGGYTLYWYFPPFGEEICLQESLSDGARYDPEADEWTPMTTDGAPTECWRNSAAVWTGQEMIVWGGCRSQARNCSEGSSSNEGGIYDPSSDSWTPTSTVGAPSSRGGHRAVWTGSEMIVWGGSPTVEAAGIYDPFTDSWTATTLHSAPEPRYEHNAHWTGREMIVWGGEFTGWLNGGFLLNNGGVYDPYGPIPDVVESLAVGQPAPGDAQLSWTLAERADTYAVVRGAVSALGPGSYGECVIQGLQEPEYVDGEPVPAGEAFTYLARGENSCGAGGLGYDSADLRRIPAPDPCP